MMTMVAGWLLLAAPATAQQPPAASVARLAPAFGAVLQAEGRTARTLLAALPAADLNPRELSLRDCMAARLDPTASPAPPPATDAFTARVLDAYRAYWRQASDDPEHEPAVLSVLATHLSTLLGPGAATGFPALDAQVGERIRSEDYHVLGGRTGRLQDLMVWSGETLRNFSVDLPEGRHDTHVFLLTDFQSRGWSTWLTCDTVGTGGWARPEGLYAVTEVYGDLQGEDFRVSFLGHETQHYADQIAWPDLPAFELEFRAKLTELSQADATRTRILMGFERNQSDNQADGHSHANRRVLTALRLRLGLAPDADLKTVPADALREAATQELFADTARRRGG